MDSSHPCCLPHTCGMCMYSACGCPRGREKEKKARSVVLQHKQLLLHGCDPRCNDSRTAQWFLASFWWTKDRYNRHVFVYERCVIPRDKREGFWRIMMMMMMMQRVGLGYTALRCAVLQLSAEVRSSCTLLQVHYSEDQLDVLALVFTAAKALYLSGDIARAARWVRSYVLLCGRPCRQPGGSAAFFVWRKVFS